MSKVYDWFEERLEVQAIADDISSKYVPPHVNIFYCLGGITFTLFLVQKTLLEWLIFNTVYGPLLKRLKLDLLYPKKR